MTSRRVTPEPTVYRIETAMVGPIHARAGTLLVVTPGHPTHTLTVLDGTATHILRHRPADERTIQNPIEQLVRDGVLRPL